MLIEVEEPLRREVDVWYAGLTLSMQISNALGIYEERRW
jgi:hypothetical protein